MDEIPEPLKKILVINAIFAFIFAFLYETLFLNIIIENFGLPGFDLLYMGIFGGTQLIFGIFALLEVYRKEIKPVQLFLEMLIAWQVITIIVNIYNGILLSFPTQPIIIIWVNNAIFLIMIVINIYYYRRY